MSARVDGWIDAKRLDFESIRTSVLPLAMSMRRQRTGVAAKAALRSVVACTRHDRIHITQGKSV